MLELARRLWIGLFSACLGLIVIDAQFMIYYFGSFRYWVLGIIAFLALICFVIGLFVLLCDIVYTYKKEHPESFNKKT